MPESYPLYTVLVMTIMPGLFILIDIVFALNKRKGDTYSEILRRIGRKWLPVIMFICFGFGLLSGHWWW